MECLQASIRKRNGSGERQVEELRLHNEKKFCQVQVLKKGNPFTNIYLQSHYSVDTGTGYWDCGPMKYECNVCTAWYFLGDRNRQNGSTLHNPKFSGCCSSGQVTSRFLLSAACVQCGKMYKNKAGEARHPNPGEICSSCGYTVSKIIPTFSDPPELLQELLTTNSAERRYFLKNIGQNNSALAMASVRAEFVSRGSGVSKYNPTVTVHSVHGRMYHEMGALETVHGTVLRYASVYIRDAEHAVSNRNHF